MIRIGAAFVSAVFAGAAPNRPPPNNFTVAETTGENGAIRIAYRALIDACRVW
jgi:hypothetical protein